MQNIKYEINDEAYRVYEELVFSAYQRASAYFYGIYMLAMKDGNMEKAHIMARKQGELAETFDMGEYYQAVNSMELAAMERDAETTIALMEKMPSNVERIGGWADSALYEHMTFSRPDEEFYAGLKRNLWKSFQDEETFGFLKEDARWKKLEKIAGRRL